MFVAIAAISLASCHNNSKPAANADSTSADSVQNDSANADSAATDSVAADSVAKLSKRTEKREKMTIGLSPMVFCFYTLFKSNMPYRAMN